MTEAGCGRTMVLVRVIVATLWALGSSASRASGNIPDNLPSGVEPEFTVRLFLKHEPWLLFAETYGSWQTDSRMMKSVLAGSYFRAMDWLKVGVFYQAQEGVRHDFDWNKDSGSWQWADTGSRVEHSLVFDASPRVDLDFLPGEHWVGELKTRYFDNFTAHEQALALRPGLTYFWLRDGQPFLNFFLQYEVWLPLNFGHKTIYESWAYLGALYHLSANVQLGGYGALKKQFWTSTDAYTQLTSNTWTAESDSTVLGLIAVFQFGL